MVTVVPKPTVMTADPGWMGGDERGVSRAMAGETGSPVSGFGEDEEEQESNGGGTLFAPADPVEADWSEAGSNSVSFGV